MLKSAPKLGYALCIAGGVMWSIGGACAQHMFRTNTVDALWYAPVRLILAGLVLILIALICGKKDGHRLFDIWKNPRDIGSLFFYALFGVGMAQTSYCVAIEYADVAFCTVLSYTAPIMLLVWVTFRARRWPRLYELLAVIFGVVGVVACSTHFDFTTMVYSPIALAMGLLNALATVVISVAPLRIIEKYGIFSVMGWGMLIAGIIATIIFRPWETPVTLNVRFFVDVAVGVFGGTICGFLFYTKGVQMVGAIAGNVLSSAEPLSAVFISVVFFKTAFTGFDALGFVLVLITVPIISIGQVREKKETQRKLSEEWAEQEAASKGRS